MAKYDDLKSYCNRGAEGLSDIVINHVEGKITGGIKSILSSKNKKDRIQESISLLQREGIIK